MHAPKMSIFETAANLELWPKILPHYRYIRYLERSPTRNVVIMAAVRSGIPITWTSEQIIDRDNLEVHFNHLKAWTKGMHVVWTFRETPNGVLVEITHDMRFRIPALAPIVDPIIGDFFIHNVAGKTLRCMKEYVEAGQTRSPHEPPARRHHRSRPDYLHRQRLSTDLERHSGGKKRRRSRFQFRYERVQRA